MSHFAVLVIGADVENQLSKYDENLELPMHLVQTKEQLIKETKDSIERYKKVTYATYLADKEEYKAKCGNNEAHIKFLEEEFPKRLNWSDEECYEYAIADYRDYIKDGEDWCEIHEDGSLWKTTNEKAKWDWYQVGGRYRGLLKLKEGAKPIELLYDENFLYNEEWYKEETAKLLKENRCDKAYRRDVVNLDEAVTFAVVKNGEWYERGDMGWFGIVRNEKDKDEWDKTFQELIKDIPEEECLTIVDCHI